LPPEVRQLGLKISLASPSAWESLQSLLEGSSTLRAVYFDFLTEVIPGRPVGSRHMLLGGPKKITILGGWRETIEMLNAIDFETVERLELGVVEKPDDLREVESLPRFSKLMHASIQMLSTLWTQLIEKLIASMSVHTSHLTSTLEEPNTRVRTQLVGTPEVPIASHCLELRICGQQPSLGEIFSRMALDRVRYLRIQIQDYGMERTAFRHPVDWSFEMPTLKKLTIWSTTGYDAQNLVASLLAPYLMRLEFEGSSTFPRPLALTLTRTPFPAAYTTVAHVFFSLQLESIFSEHENPLSLFPNAISIKVRFTGFLDDAD
jgi:hypothetical protein